MTFEKILTLKKELDAKIFTLGRRAENARTLIQHLYSCPTVSLTDIETVVGVKRNPARELLAGLKTLDVLEEVTGFKRNRIFLFRRYLAIFKDHQIDFHMSDSATEREL